MSDTKFTPEKWEIYEGGNFVYVGLEGYVKWSQENHYLGGPLVIARMERQDAGYQRLHEQRMVDAHLIAAAPDLYAALEKLTNATQSYISIGGMPPHRVNHMVDLMDQARAALKRARGE